jgi:peptidoglycan/xylan/chitin deacetylase (PgdA/CDA1 family)
MRALKKAGYTPITFDQLGAGINGKLPLPEKPILITFDDGYKNVLKFAHPILSKLQMRYTVFVVTGKIGQANDWVVPEGFEPSALMDWDEIREIRASGLADIQPHTISHRRLSRMSKAELAEELTVSKAKVEQVFQTPTHTICYPYGDHSAAVIEEAKEAGFTYGVTTDFGRVRKEDGLLSLPRISIHHVPYLSLEYGISTMNYWWKIKSRVDRRS